MIDGIDIAVIAILLSLLLGFSAIFHLLALICRWLEHICEEKADSLETKDLTILTMQTVIVPLGIVLLLYVTVSLSLH